MGGSLAGLPAPVVVVVVVLLLLPPPLCSSSQSLSASEFSRADFPPDFVFGAGTSAYQVEGAVNEDGKGPSIWTPSHTQVLDGSTADVTADGYHHYKLMSEIGLEGYRFSISWSSGRGVVNTKGVEYYNNLINELVNHGIQPHVTLYHLDLPQALEDEYQGWLSPKIVDDFVAYADLCFREFGDRVSYWTTINEANILAIGAYDNGVFAPGRCSYPFGIFNCTAGNSTVEPYIAEHNVLLAHAAAAELYRTKYQAIQKGSIGINVYTFGFYSRTNTTADLEATRRAIDFWVGWVLDPLVFGDYPKSMKKIVGSKIPSITDSQSKQLKGSIDFIAINYYSSLYVSNDPTPKRGLQDFNGDTSALFQSYLLYLKDTYGNLPSTSMKMVRLIFYEFYFYLQLKSTPTGYNVTLDDTVRINAIKSYIGGILSAIRRGANTRGYFIWSFLDVFELLTGYRMRFGLYFVDFEDKNRTRKPKLSALWYRDFLMKTNELKAI
ncbi:unnamed protein product [Spirodela intermedia]|uniref:Uncharacterized protein n=1 Tax=Spirodela intermedia TaxID=51605 RepID=A0A7I8IZZ2_SPIIN|nr:unnamed protein product [Spirodela intermedia]CAA6663448.1 unnamed protein product [Spirodela intermedia]